MTGWVMKEHGFPNSRIIVIKQVEDYINNKGIHASQWLCECTCENHTQFIVKGNSLSSGHTQSCGCIQKEKASKIGKQSKKYNKWLDEVFADGHGNYRIGFTSNTNEEFYVDEEDFDKVKDYCWCEKINKNGYRSLRSTDKETGNCIIMAWLISGKRFDHKDHNPLNNRKYNLRPATPQENNQNKGKSKNNTSGITGVSWSKQKSKWKAQIWVNYKNNGLGYYSNKNDAIIARLNAESQYFGEFAPQKHLFEQYNIKTLKKGEEEND